MPMSRPDPYVVVIGGAAIDITGFPRGPFHLGDSNPGRISTASGGVGRNIAENLARLGIPVKMLTALGDDDLGHRLREESERIGIDLTHALMPKDECTATYLAIVDEEGDMKAAIASMDIFEHITPDYVRGHDSLLRSAAAIVVDANLSQPVLTMIAEEYGDCPLFVDTVSSSKAAKLKPVLGAFHTIKPNRYEAEFLSGQGIHTADDLLAVKNWFITQGVKRVFISLGPGGVVYGDELTYAQISPAPLKMVNSTGAGDAFMAGLVYGYLHNYTLEATAMFAQAMAALTARSPRTVHPEMSLTLVQSMLPSDNPLGEERSFTNVHA